MDSATVLVFYTQELLKTVANGRRMSTGAYRNAGRINNLAFTLAPCAGNANNNAADKTHAHLYS